jgi:guanylate kinase
MANPEKQAQEKKGTLFIVSAPSGAGKTTLCRGLRDRFPDLNYSISYTTRKPRKGERNGKDYYFISKADFLRDIEKNRWAEWAEVHGNYYGTSRTFLDRLLASGRDILLDIDIKGMEQILSQYPDSATIFIMPPSTAVLRQRLEKRGTEDRDVIEKRIKAAQAEMEQKHLYQHLIVNDQLESALGALSKIVETYRTDSQSKKK